MPEDTTDQPAPPRQRIAWGQISATTFLMLLCAIIAGIIQFHYTSREPYLEYEVFPPTHLGDAAVTSVYIVRVENSGSKEAENVKVFLKLKDGSTIRKMAVTPSMTSLKPTTQKAESDCSRSTEFKLLNPGVSCKFSILAENAGKDDIKVEVSADGITGKERTTGQVGGFASTVFTTLCMATGMLAAGLLAFIITRSYRQRIDRLTQGQEQLMETVVTQNNAIRRMVDLAKGTSSNNNK